MKHRAHDVDVWRNLVCASCIYSVHELDLRGSLLHSCSELHPCWPVLQFSLLRRLITDVLHIHVKPSLLAKMLLKSLEEVCDMLFSLSPYLWIIIIGPGSHSLERFRLRIVPVEDIKSVISAITCCSTEV